MSAIIDRIRKAFGERRSTLQGGSPWPLSKGDVPGHEFHGNQYKDQADEHTAMEQQHRLKQSEANGAGNDANATQHRYAADAHQDAAQFYRQGNKRQGDRFGADANARSAKLGMQGSKAKPGLTPGAVVATGSAGTDQNRGGV